MYRYGKGANRFRNYEEPEVKFTFKSVKILKEAIIGSGSYGAVREAKCDELLCAAKTLHPTLFDQTGHFQIAPHTENTLSIGKYEKECEQMTMVRHPNIIQYLGLHKDEIGLPVLLMELMHDSLTDYLEESSEAVLYHIQVNLSHDIALALSFLHSNNIVHRNLSSNNVMLTRDLRAKVSDFGMARLGDITSQESQLPPAIRPGVDVYMPPEAVQEKPEYNDKVDCFSFGVIVIQILTRKYPAPGNRHKRIELQSGSAILIVPEMERRNDHIKEIDGAAPLRPIALDCLKDKHGKRPSAQQLCEKLSGLAENQDYIESKKKDREQIQRLEKKLKRKQRKIERLKKKIPEDELTSR